MVSKDLFSRVPFLKSLHTYRSDALLRLVLVVRTGYLPILNRKPKVIKSVEKKHISIAKVQRYVN